MSLSKLILNCSRDHSSDIVYGYGLVCMQSKMLSSCHRHLCIILHLRSALKSPVKCSERYERKQLPVILDVYSFRVGFE